MDRTTVNKIMKRFLSAALCFVLILSLCVTGLAEETTGKDASVKARQEEAKETKEPEKTKEPSEAPKTEPQPAGDESKELAKGDEGSDEKQEDTDASKAEKDPDAVKNTEEGTAPGEEKKTENEPPSKTPDAAGSGEGSSKDGEDPRKAEEGSKDKSEEGQKNEQSDQEQAGKTQEEDPAAEKPEKDDPKDGSKPDPADDSKDGTEADPKDDPKADPKDGSKAGQKDDPKDDPKADPKDGSKPDPKDDSKNDPQGNDPAASEGEKSEEDKIGVKGEENTAADSAAMKQEQILVRTSAAAQIDDSTTLADGDYTDFEFSWEGGTGKARLVLEKIRVLGGKATGFFTASSANMSHVFYLGHTQTSDDDPAYYDPKTGKCAEGVKPITDQQVSFPVCLNKKTDVSCRTTAMSVPHWVHYSYTITIDEGTKPEEPADYSKVEAARKRVPKDLSIYKKARVEALQKALDAVEEGLPASEQDRVDAFAEAIEKAIDALEKEALTIRLRAVDSKTGKKIKNASFNVTNKKGKTVKPVKDGVYELEDGTYTVRASAKGYTADVIKGFTPTAEDTLTLKLEKKEVIPKGTIVFRENEKDPSKTNLFNTTAMFKVVKGTLDTGNSKSTLTIVLNGAGYHYLFKGTYEEALANGLNKKNWIRGKVNADGKWEFVIPVGASETFLPIIAVSDAHLQKVEAGEEELGDAIFARQLVLDLKKKTLTAGDYNAVENIAVISKTQRFKAESAGTMEVVGGPNSNNYACCPVITMQDDLYGKAFIGTAENAAKKGAKIIARNNDSFRFEFVNSFGAEGKVITFEDKKPVAVAFYNTKEKKWEDYKLTIDKGAATVTIEALKEDEAPPEEPEKPEEYKDDSNEGTNAVDSNTTLADGVYTPKSFTFSGGTGKVVISCDRLEVKGGQAYATIRFSKSNGQAASVDSLRANGTTYGGNNVFTIPVELNANNKIVARTTAMSQPHWIEYSIYIALDEPGKESSEGEDLAENTTEMDDEAPKILGLVSDGETPVVYSDLLKIFNYEDGYHLIEIDAVRDTARDTVKYRAQMEKEALEKNKSSKDAGEKELSTDEPEEAEADLSEEEAQEGAAAESMSDRIAALYQNEIVKYLVIPEGKEVPAGLDKEVIIISLPSDRSYVSSETALGMIAELGALSSVAATGMKEVKDPAVSAADPAYGGPFDDWDLRLFITEKIDLAVQSSDILPKDEKTIEKDMENLIRLGQRSAQMEMAMFIDRSADEDDPLARSEWYKVYGVLFGREEKAEQLYQAAVNEASEEEKAQAEERIGTRAEEKNKMKAEAKKAAGED